jgi:hypothetical protein
MIRITLGGMMKIFSLTYKKLFVAGVILVSACVGISRLTLSAYNIAYQTNSPSHFVAVSKPLLTNTQQTLSTTSNTVVVASNATTGSPGLTNLGATTASYAGTAQAASSGAVAAQNSSIDSSSSTGSSSTSDPSPAQPVTSNNICPACIYNLPELPSDCSAHCLPVKPTPFPGCPPCGGELPDLPAGDSVHACPMYCVE